MIRKVAVLGAGTMGAQIAAHIANAGLPVTLLDVTAEQARKGLENLAKITPPPLFVPERAHYIETDSFDNGLKRLQTADWIIEAVIEEIDVKKRLLDSVEPERRPGTFITTNTSGLSVS